MSVVAVSLLPWQRGKRWDGWKVNVSTGEAASRELLMNTRRQKA